MAAREYGKLASLRPANTDEAELYAPASGEQANIVICVCNQDTSTRTYRVALTDSSGTAGNDDWLRYDREIEAAGWAEIPVSIKYPQTVRIKASIADKLSFVVHGQRVY